MSVADRYMLLKRGVDLDADSAWDHGHKNRCGKR